MKKSDLRPGMVVECANRTKFMVVSTGILSAGSIVNINSFISLEHFTEDLRYYHNDEYTIMHVFDIVDSRSLCDYLGKSRGLREIWTRYPIVKVTKEQIAKEFGTTVDRLEIVES